MIHIGIDLRVLATGRVSGVEEYTHQLLAQMLPLDRNVRFTLLALGRQPIVDETWMTLPNVHIRHVRSSNRLMMARMRVLGRPYLDALAGDPTVFFFPHFIYGALSPRCRRVVTFHDLSFERFPEFFSLRRRLWHRVHMRPRHQARRADRLIAVSHSTARDLTEFYGVDPNRIEIIHSGIDPALRRPPDAALLAFRRYYGIHDRFILSLCTREPRKNLVGLVRAFELLKNDAACRDVQLVIAGPRGWLEGELMRTIRSSPVSHRIHLIGPIERHQRASAYGAASLLAYPSFFEGFGFPPLEAMACGVPTVASQNSSIPEVVGDAGLLVDPYDIQAMATAMKEVLSDRSLAAHLISKGTARSTRFTWQQAAERTLETLVHTV